MSVAGIKSQLYLANRSHKAIFAEAFESAQARWAPIIDAMMMPISSNGEGNYIHFSDAVPQLEEWIDDRKISKLGVDGFFLKNVAYAMGIAVDRDDIEDENLGLYAPRIRQMADNGVKLWKNRIKALFNLGFSGSTGLTYDGLEFFSASHDSGSNLSTDIFDSDAFEAAELKLLNQVDTEDEPLDMRPTHIIHGNDLVATVRSFLNQDVLATGETNPYKGVVKQLVIPGLTSTNWALADLSHPIKPFVKQTRRELAMSQMVNPENPDVYMRKTFHWGCDMRGAAGYGMHQCIVGSTGAS